MYSRACLGWLITLLVGLIASGPRPSAHFPRAAEPRVHTFSIVAYDPEKKEWGVGVASKYLAVGAVVPWARAGVGAIATQSAVNVSYGPQGLKLLREGKTPADVVKLLTAKDAGREERQLGVIDAEGATAAFTGRRCYAWAGSRAGKNYSCQGNLLTGEEVVQAMGKAFAETKGPLCWRILAALEDGERAGGDARGKQSAAVLVVREGGGVRGLNDRYVDFRVDDHAEPVRELARILALRVPRPAKR